MQSRSGSIRPLLARSGVGDYYRRMRTGQRLFTVCIVTMLIPLFGCSSFNRDFRSAVAARADASGGTVEGPWSGKWISDAGHGGGKLRCILTQVSPEQYQARFEATFWGIFRGGYDVMLNAEEVEAIVKFTGEQDLGWLAGGKYQYEGMATPEAFNANYTSKHDRGRFEMARPGEEGE